MIDVSMMRGATLAHAAARAGWSMRTRAPTRGGAAPLLSPFGPLTLVHGKNFDVDPRGWNALAMACGASHEGSHAHIRAQALKLVGRGSVHFFALRAPDGRRVGQCAVAAQGRRFEVIDGLQLLPECRMLWRDAMARILACCGAGDYVYGSRWHIETPRTTDLSTIVGVCQLRARPLVIQAVALGDWPDFDRYWRKTSENVRRNARYAVERLGFGAARHDWRFAALRSARLAELQRDSLSGKGLRFSLPAQAARLLSKALWHRDALDLWIARDPAGKMIAFLDVIRFGDNFEYVLGGQQRGVDGAHWLLLREAIQAAYLACPKGRFVMGSFEEAVHDEATGGGLLRARRSLRVTDYPASIVSFRYL